MRRISLGFLIGSVECVTHGSVFLTGSRRLYRDMYLCSDRSPAGQAAAPCTPPNWSAHTAH